MKPRMRLPFLLNIFCEGSNWTLSSRKISFPERYFSEPPVGDCLQNCVMEITNLAEVKALMKYCKRGESKEEMPEHDAWSSSEYAKR